MSFRTYCLAAAMAATLAGTSQAAQVAALTGDNTITVIDVDAGKVAAAWKVDGAAGRLLGIDVRPADGMLYGLMADGNIVTIDTRTGKVATKSKLDTMLSDGVTATVDFNPVADRLRIIGSDGTSLRVNVEDGKATKDGSLKYADSDINKGKTPRVVAGAYSNSFKGTKETTLYDIDAAASTLVRQAPPNDGILNTIGTLDVSGDTLAFDISSDSKGGNEAWLLADGVFYKVDLTIGKATAAGKIEGVPGQARDLAILPSM